MASESVPSDIQATLEKDLLEFLEISNNIVVLTGAGASTESGIPDFRSPDGIWRRYPPGTYQDFISKPEERKRYWELRRVLVKQVTEARPNAAHLALAELERMGKLSGVITQNFDGLHQDAGNAPERVIELHGTSRAAACTLCGARSSISALLQRIDAGEEDPQCELCGGYLKAATILFGQPLPRAELERAIALTQACDLFLVIGSSLRVSPAARLPMLAVERGMPLVIINREPTPLDPHAAIVLRANAGETMTRLMARFRKTGPGA